MNIEVFGKQNCSFCKDAKTLLDMKGLEYTYTDFFELDSVNQGDILENRAAGAASFPIIIINNTYIGGYINLKSAL